MARVGRYRAIVALICAAALLAGCTRVALELDSRRLLGDRIRNVQVFHTQSEPGVGLELTPGPVPEAAACELLRLAAASVPESETAAVNLIILRSDGTSDLVDYHWSARDARLVRFEGRSEYPTVKGEPALLREVAFADGATSDELASIASGATHPRWQPWLAPQVPPHNP